MYLGDWGVEGNYMDEVPDIDGGRGYARFFWNRVVGTKGGTISFTNYVLIFVERESFKNTQNNIDPV